MYDFKLKDNILYITEHTSDMCTCGHKIELDKLSFMQKVNLKHIFDELYFKEYINE